MFFQKDELSKFDFVSTKVFLLILVLVFFALILSILGIPFVFKKILPVYSIFFDSKYFAIFLLFISMILIFYIVYLFCCKQKNKSLKDGLFLYPRSRKTYLISALIGVLVPLLSLPILFKYVPKDFYATDLLKEEGGMIFLIFSALLAPVFEEIFYRGLVFPFFQSKINSVWAVMITSVFFGVSHYMNIGDAKVLVSLFILYGFVLTYIRYITNSLIPPIITHLVHNLTLMACCAIMHFKNLFLPIA